MARVKRMLLYLAVLAGCLPELAEAAPVVLAAVSAAASVGIGAIFGQAITWAAFGKAFLGSLAISALQGLTSKSQAPLAQTARGSQVIVRGAVENRKVIYGRALVSGPLVFADSRGPSNNFLKLVLPLAHGECARVGDVYLYEDQVPLGALNDLGHVTTGKFRSGSAGTETVETLAVPASAPYQVTVAEATVPAGAIYSFARWFSTVEVIDITTTTTLTVTSGMPGANQYSVSAGVYTVHASRAGNSLSIRYLYKHARVGVRKYLGTTTQTADAGLIASTNGKWTSAHRLRGVTYLVAELAWDAAAFPNGVPNVRAEVWGRTVYDPRDGATRWTENPALCLRDYLTAGYGLACESSEIDDATFIAAANLCEERVGVEQTGSPTYAPTFTVSTSTSELTFASTERRIQTGDRVSVSSTGTLPAALTGSPNDFFAIRTGPTTIKLAGSYAAALAYQAITISDAGSGTHSLRHIDHVRYNCNGVVDLGERPRDIIEKLLSSCAGALVWSEGQYKLYVGAYVTPAKTLTVADLRGALNVKPRMDRKDLYNAVRGVFVDPARGWQVTDFPMVENATYETQDGGIQIARDIQLPFTIDAIRAQRIAKIHLEKSRQGIRLTWPGKLTCFDVTVWSTVRVTVAQLGWSEKIFLVIGWRFADDGGVDLDLVEEASAVYDWNAGQATIGDAAPDTELPSAEVDALAALAAASGTAQLFVGLDGTVHSRIRLTWSAVDNVFVTSGGTIEIEYAATSGSPQTWLQAGILDGSATEAYIGNVQDGVAYDIRARARNLLLVAGDWSYVYGHTVIGKTAEPSNVSSFSAVQQSNLVIFQCDTVTDADLDLVEIRYNPQGSTSWADGTPLVNMVRGQSVTSAAVPPGDWTFVARARDTSGNYSATTASYDLSVTSDGYTRIASQEQAPDWLGTASNFVRHWTGKLIPESTKLASEHTRAELFEQFVPYPQSSCTYTAPEIDKSIDTAARVYATIDSALGPGVASGQAAPTLLIDHRTTAGAYDGYESWTVGVVAFRYVTARLTLDTSIGKAIITSFAPTIDGALRTEQGAGVSVASGGTAITFAAPFHSAPNLQVTPVGSTARVAGFESRTASGFTARTFDPTTGAGASGTVDWSATGV